MSELVDIIRPIEYGIAFTDQQKAEFRESIADALDKLNTKVVDASNLDRYDADSYLTKEEFNRILGFTEYPEYKVTDKTVFSGGLYDIFDLFNQILGAIIAEGGNNG